MEDHPDFDGPDVDPAQRSGTGALRAGITRVGRRRLSELGEQLPDLPVVRSDDDGAVAGPVDDAEHDSEAEGRRREDQQRLVDALVAAGLDDEEAQAAVQQDRVPFALATRILGEEARYTRADLAVSSGLEQDTIAELDRATGRAPSELYTQSELDAMHLIAQLAEAVPLDSVIRSARARSHALAAIVRGDLALIRDELVRPMRQAGADDLTVAVALAEHAAEFERISRRLLVSSYQRHLRDALGAELSSLAARTPDAPVRACIGFVDLVGYTALAARVDPTGLDELLDEFESRVVDAVAGSAGVSVVKYLGDAAMLVAAELGPLVDVLLAITEPWGVDDEVPIRGGLARGEVLMREGDFFGTPVNLAARLTDLARPWTVLADDDLRDDLRERYTTRRIRRVHLRGVGMRRPVAVRGARDAEDDQDATVE